jgi:hypothetical protein
VKSNYERSTIKEAYLAEQEAQNKHDQDDKGNHQEQTTSVCFIVRIIISF